MAEMDDKTLKNLDKELQDMNTHLSELDNWLKQLKKDSDVTFDEKLIKSWSETIKKIDFSNITKKQLKELKKQISEVDKTFAKALKGGWNIPILDDKRAARHAQNLMEYKDVQAAREYLQLLKQINSQEVINKANSSSSKITEKVVSKESLDAQKKITDELKKQESQHKKNNNEIKKQKGTVESLLPSIQRLASAFGVAFSLRGLAQFGKKLVETRGEFEMQFVAMKQIIGDVDAATKIWNQTMQQALQSPFKAMQLVTYTKQLAAYRIETEKLFDTTKRLADISAGLGVDMGRLILAYGQVKSANFLRASEIRQFTEAGVNIVGNLAQYFSELEGRAVSTAEVMERVTKRMVSFADVEEIFRRMTDEGGEFYKMQEVQADTVKGQINKLHDAYDQMLNTIGQANQGTIRKFVEILNNMVRNWRDIVPLIKSSVAILGTYVAVTKLARMGTQKYGDAIVRLRLGKKKQTVEMEAALVKETLLLNRQAKTITAWQYQTQKAIFNVKMAWKALGGIFKSFAPFLAIEGALYAFNKIREPIREARRLTEDLANIRVDNKSRADEEVNNYDKLIRRFNELNRGSIERKEIIDKLNSQYGKYIGFQVSETTTLNDLAEAQERVNLNIREKARLRAEEEAQQRIAEDYMQRESKLLNPTQAWGVKDVYTFLYNDASMLSGKNTMWLANVEKFAEYAQTKIHDLTDEELKSRQELVNATGEWLNTFYGVSGATDISKGLVDLVELYAEQEQKLRDERKQISEDLKGLPLQVQEDILAMQSEVATAMQKLTKAEAGEKVEIPLLDNMRIVVPPDLAEKSGVWEVIKQEINKRQEDFKIKLKLDAGAITEDQAEELRKQAQTTGDIFVDAVNKEISEGILKDAGIEGTFDELKKQIIDYPEMISDWDKVNDAIELINSNLITASDITNGLTNYTKILSENLGNGREAIDEAVKRQNLLVDGTEEEVKKAQEAVDKAKERYKWLLKIAKLLGLDTKSADEIVEEEGYDLSVGQFRLAAAQSAFMEKFGKASNAYGKQLSQIGVTENLKEVADAYHKQSDELDGLIKNQEKALENETNLTEEQKENAKTTIENLKEQKSMAEFLAEFFGYVPKKTTTRTTHENASKLISLIKEMRSEYDKLSKSAYGYAKSEEKVRESYKDSVKEILGKAGITDYDFTTNEGMIKALEKVKSYATKLGKDAAAEVQKYIDQLETEIEINAQVRIREDFGRQMEKAFGDYELTLDIEKLNLPSDVLADMFDIETVDLSDLRNKVVQFYEERAAIEADPTELVKQVEGYYKKIDDMERKQQRERIKEYAKYLEYELSERAKIEMEYVRKSAEVETTRGLTKEQRDTIDKRLKKERDEKLAKQEWEDFKSSETYIQMMEDLEHQGVGALEVMRQELERIRENAENLSPRALKEVVNALEKINEITIKRGMPIGNIIRANAGIASAKEAAIGAGLEKEQVESRKAARDTLENIKKTILEREKEYRTLSNELGVEKELARLESERTKNNAKMEAMFGDTFEAESDEQIQQRIAEAVGNIETSRKNIAEYQEQAKEADEETLRTISTKVAEEESNLECLLAERGLLEEALRLRLAIAKAEANRGDLTDEERKHLQERVEQLEEELKRLQAQAGAVGSVTKAYGILGDTVQDAFQKMGQWGSQVEQTFESFKGMMQALGTDVDTDTWDTLSTSFSVLNTATSTAASAAAKFASGDYIGASLDIIKGLMDIATQIAELHDKKIDRSIEKSKEKVEDLEKAYDRLEKSIEKTFDTVSYIREYNQEVQNLNEQIEEANNQIAAAQDYKSEDKRRDAIEAAEDAKQQALDALEEIKQKQIEVFGGIGEDNYRSAAEGFVEAWKSAFLETGDGLQGLQDHFDEFLNDWFVKQATMKIAANKLAPLFQKIDQAVGQYGDEGTNVSWRELQEINELKDSLLEQTNEQLKELAGVFGLGGEGSLSGLAAGIQGMTEEQANVLEAYWNIVRENTININNNVADILGLLRNGAGGVGGGEGKGNIFGDPNVETNPMLKQLDLIAVNTAATHRILESVTKSGHSQGGYGIKVFAD